MATVGQLHIGDHNKRVYNKMGCASSTPLVESGKNLVEAAKDSANDAVNMGEKAFHGKKIDF